MAFTPKGFLPDRFSKLFVVASVFSFLPLQSVAASLNVYLSAPGSQSTYIGLANTETFNSLTPGVQTTPFASAIGTYEFSNTAKFAAVAADQYGGADGSQYVALGAQSRSSAPVTLQLSNNATYFGFWWSAGDVNNGISFYYNDTLLSRLSTADIVSLLSSNGGHVTAIDQTVYAENSYYGNPNNGSNSREPYAYVSVFANQTGFNRIVFDNSGRAGSGFETDNHSVYLGAVQPNGASVFVESAPAVAIPGIFAAPEPVSLGLSVLGLTGIALAGRRHRRV